MGISIAAIYKTMFFTFRFSPDIHPHHAKIAYFSDAVFKSGHIRAMIINFFHNDIVLSDFMIKFAAQNFSTESFVIDFLLIF